MCQYSLNGQWNWLDTYLVEVAVGKLLARMSSLDTGAVDQNANLVSIGKDLGHERSNRFLRRQVGSVDKSLSSQLLDGLLCRVDSGIPLQSSCQHHTSPTQSPHEMTYLDKDDIGTSLGKTNCDGLANATGATSDESSLALKREE